MLAYSLTENQIIAGVVSVIILVALNWVLPYVSDWFTNFSLVNIFSNFPKGQIDIADTVTFIAFTIMNLLLTIVVMQRRKSVR